MKKKTQQKEQVVIVSFLDNDYTQPDCIWIYYNKPPIGDKPYGSIHGYWDDGKAVEIRKSAYYLLDYDTFKATIVPKLHKEYDSIKDFEKEMFTNRL